PPISTGASSTRRLFFERAYASRSQHGALITCERRSNGPCSNRFRRSFLTVEVTTKSRVRNFLLGPLPRKELSSDPACGHYEDPVAKGDQFSQLARDDDHCLPLGR